MSTAVCPSTEMMWLRTTLVFRNGRGWEFLEFSEFVSEVEELEGRDALLLAHIQSSLC